MAGVSSGRSPVRVDHGVSPRCQAGPAEGTLAAAIAAKENGKTAADEPVVLVGDLTMPGNGFRLPVSAAAKSRLGAYAGKHVVLGIRPEHFHLKPTAT